MTKSTKTGTRNLLATAMYTLKVVKDGANAQYVIVSGEQVFRYANNFSGTPTPAIIKLTATKFNITNNGKWQYKNASGVWTDWLNGSTVVTSTELTVSPTSGILASAKSMQIRYIIDGKYYDEITIVKVSDGANGNDAYTVILSNESHTFPGSTSTALAGSTTSSVIAYKGGTRVATNINAISGIPTGMTITPTNNGSANAGFTVNVTTQMTSKSGTINIPITVDGKSFTKTFSYALALKGNTGSTGAQGPTGPQGPQGEAKDYYDGTFMDGKKYWSTTYTDTYTAPGTNVMVVKEATSKGGGNVLQIQNDTWLYAKNKIAIEEGRIYKFTFRVRQTQDPLNGADKNKVYAGATTFNAAGDRLSPNNGTYFIISSAGITVANGWKEYTAYMSTTARAALVSVDKKTLCPAVKAFDVNTKAIKPMFIVNYSGGQGIAQVDYLTVEDYTQEWNALNIAKDKLNNDSQKIFDMVTEEGKKQGIFMQGDELFINGQYINAYNLTVKDTNERLTLGIDDKGNVTLRATTLEIGTKPVASQEHVSTSINNIQVGGRNLMPNTGFYAGLKDWAIFNSSTNLSIENGRFGETSRAAQVTLANVAGSGIRTPYCSCTPGAKYVASFWVKVSKACRVGQLLKFRDSSNTETNPINAVYQNISANTWTLITQAFTAPSTAVKIASTPRIEAGIGTDATFLVTEFKLEQGTKATTWSPAPEDIDNDKISTGDAIEDINNTPEGQIQYPKLNIKGQVNFTDFDPHLAKHYNVKKDAQGNIIETVINGGTIATGSVTADQMTMYNLSVVRRKKVNNVWQDIDTSFNIDEAGHIKASGTFSSFNFNEITKDKGWCINEEGDSVFNNTLVRGTVELPHAGMTDYGSDGNKNLVKNSNFRDGNNHWTSILSGCGFDADKRCEEAYSFKISKSGQTTANYGGTRQTIINTAIPAKSYYTVSGYYFVENKSLLDGTFACELKGRATGGSETALGTYPTWSKTTCTEGAWTYFSYTVETNKAFDNAYIYPWVQKNGTVWFSKIKVEEGSTATPWTPHKDEEDKSLRFWSGASFVDRLDAPFQVLQDGTVKATRGEFGGTFTGRVEIGNIKIYDTNDSEGTIEIKNKNDVSIINRIGENKSYFNSPLIIGTEEDKLTTGQYNVSFKFSPSTKKMQLFSGSSIIVADTKENKLSLINNNNNGYIKFGTDVRMDGYDNAVNVKSEKGGKISVNIGNFADASTHDDASLNVDGGVTVNHLTISYLRIFENPDGDGVDFFVE